ncbi:MAG TPA: RHS repeat-associated core domain-containing protein, partial [Cellvibrio sp.]|nr:RHS repeat-associated core domain-containing protein [Cellvibrio sp.]
MVNTGEGFSVAKELYGSDEKNKLSKNQKISFSDINHDGFVDVVWRDLEYGSNMSGSYDDIMEDNNGNSIAEALTRIAANRLVTLYAKQWNPALGEFGNTFVLLDKERTNANFDYTFVDINGDGWTDRVATAIYGKSSFALFDINGFSSESDYTNSGIVPQAQINKITNGLGGTINISYEPMGRSKNYLPMDDIKVTSEMLQKCTIYDGMKETPPVCTTYPSFTIDTPSFYKRLNDPFAGIGNLEDRVPAPVLEVLAPISIVTRVDNSAPLASNPDALNSIIYSYKYLRMQAAGRGMLGFSMLATQDAQTGVITETQYRQDWPHTGAPWKTIVKTADGKLLSRAVNEWDRRVVKVGNSKLYQPYLKQSIEQSYSLNTNAAGEIVSGALVDEAGNVSAQPLQTVTTTTEMMDDDYGNIRHITVTTEGGGDALVKTTTNKYFNDPWKDQMGRLESSEVSSTLNGVSDPTHKKVKFDYYPQGSAENGLLKQEVVLDKAGNDYLKTEYKYDRNGNKMEVSVSGEAEAGRMETRKTVYGYDSNGRYLVSTTNDLSQAATIDDRNPVTGQPTKVSDINQVQAQVFYDVMGKEYLRIDATGAWSRSDTSYCAATTACPAGAVFFTQTRVAGGGLGTNYYDRMGRAIRSSKIGFDGTTINIDTEYDFLSRSKRQSEAYFANQTATAWVENVYDILGQLVSVTLLDGSKTTNTRTDNATTITNALGQSRIETRNGLGQLVQVEDQLKGTIHYTYTIDGALKTATTTSPDHPAEVVVRICYDFLGRKIGMLDPDKGGWLATNTRCDNLADNSLGWWTYSYNAFGELITQKDAKGQVTRMGYDQLGRMIKRQDEEQTRWFYDKSLDGSSTAGSQGKLMEVVVRKNTSEITSYLGSDDYTHYSYDSLGRLTDTLVMHPNDSSGYISSVKYDSIGRAYEMRDALNGAVFVDSGVQTQYNIYGYAYRSIDIAPVGGGKGILNEITRTNARGQILEELRNNGAFVVVNAYNDKTGLLESQKASSALTSALGLQSTIQDQTYGWDSLGNLKFRTNKSANVGSSTAKNISESFCYDGLNRLTATVKNTAELNPACGAEDIKYDGLGNITYKKDLGDYHYGDQDGNAGPHAVTSITQGSTKEIFKYDANGNMLQDNQRAFSYTSYDMVKSLSKNSSTTQFSYGADRARWQRVDSKSGITTTTTYLGNIERIQRSNSSEVEWKRYAGGAIFTYKTSAQHQWLSNASHTAFVFNDHLGSVDVITDSNGKVIHSLSFDPWGARRDGDTWSSLTDAQRIAALKIDAGNIFAQPITTRGFTGHEMLDDMGIIHMNGRIYDARLGRFLQADPYIQAAANTQNYNRYSYVLNNPLNMTDPSGFNFLKKAWNEIRPFVGAIVAIVATVLCEGNTACGSAAWAWIGAVSGAAGAAANGGNIAIGALTGILTAYAGGGSDWAGFLSRGVAGGVSSVMMGGKFGHGFISAGIGGAVGGGASSWEGFVSSAFVGGTISEITGGKFANGAAGAAFVYAVGAGVRRIAEGGGVEEVDGDSAGASKNFIKNPELADNITFDENGNAIIKATVSVEGGQEKQRDALISKVSGKRTVKGDCNFFGLGCKKEYTLTIDLEVYSGNGVGDLHVVSREGLASVDAGYAKFLSNSSKCQFACATVGKKYIYINDMSLNGNQLLHEVFHN